jgi:LmbE family N-acetylglucosaminyl deacetylase
VPEVYLFGAPSPNVFIDIAGVLDVKVAALKEHRSQMGEWDPATMIAAWAREQGRRRGLQAAEVYRRMTLGGP